MNLAIKSTILFLGLIFPLLPNANPAIAAGNEFNDFLSTENTAVIGNTEEGDIDPYAGILSKKLLGYSKKWIILMAVPKEKRVCYSLIYNNKRIGNHEAKSAKPYLMIHRVQSGKERISIFFGYKLLQTSQVYLSIDGKQFILKPFSEFALSASPKTDKQIISLLKTANTLRVRGNSVDGHYTVDEYIVEGFQEVHNKLKKYCL